jgi:hypothetical protein
MDFVCIYICWVLRSVSVLSALSQIDSLSVLTPDTKSSDFIGFCHRSLWWNSTIASRQFDNFQFVNFTKFKEAGSIPSAFALAALMEVPGQCCRCCEIESRIHQNMCTHHHHHHLLLGVFFISFQININISKRIKFCFDGYAIAMNVTIFHNYLCSVDVFFLSKSI